MRCSLSRRRKPTETPRAPTREEILRVVEELVQDGDALLARTRERFAVLPEVDTLVAFFGVKVLRALRIIPLLAPHHVDDQIAVLVRGLVECTVDLEFLITPTPGNKKDVTIQVEDKGQLFQSFRFIELAKMQGYAFVNEQFKGLTEDDKLALRQAQKQREDLGISRSPYWRGVSFRKAIEQLRAQQLDVRRLALFQQLDSAFSHLSYYTHSNATFGVMRDEFDADMFLVFAVIAASHVFCRWHIILEQPDSFLAPVKRRNDYWRRIGFQGE